MQFSLHEPTQAPHQFVALIPKVCTGAVGRAANVDVSDDAVAAPMREPGASMGSLTQDVGSGGGIEDRLQQAPLDREIAPDRRSSSQARSPRISLGDSHGCRGFLAPPLGQREGRAQPGECAQDLADVAEVERRIETLHEVENVASRVARRIPPAASAMADDQDFTLAASVLQAGFCALLTVEAPGRRRALQNDRTMEPFRAGFRFRDRNGSCRDLPCLSRESGLTELSFCLCAYSRGGPRGGRAAKARGTRGSLRRTLVGAAGASGSHLNPLFRFSFPG